MNSRLSPPGWDAPELGLPRATALAILIVSGMAILAIRLTTLPRPQPAPQIIQVMHVTLTELPRPAPPAPPAPPRTVPPPKPAPAVIPKPPPVESKLPMAVKPPPPARHAPKPQPRRPAARHTAPPAPAPAPAPQPAPAAPPPTSGIGPYGDQIYSIIQANQAVPDVVAQLGLSGTAVVEITVAPSGRILSAKIAKSSGVPLIDQTALQHAQAASLPPFNNQMPQAPHRFLVPIEISPSGSE
ncbi:MAG: TonB family protein [Acidocella sp.]|nr:TonB family protein [Acidocella sp.]